MNRALQYALSEQSYLYDALRILRAAKATGVLRVIAERGNGRIAFEAGRPRGAHNALSGSGGDRAAAELAAAGIGVFHFAQAPLPANLAEYEISQHYGDRLEEMAQDARVVEFDNVFRQFVGSLPAHDQELVSAFRHLSEDAEREAFLQENPNFLKYGSLNEQQLVVVRLYSRLNNEIDKRAFLKKNPRFNEFIDAVGLSDLQRQNLEHAKYVVADRNVDFANFCRQLFGKTYPDLSEDQAAMLKSTFLRLATQENRKAFLAINPLLSEDAPVLRGEEVLPFVRLDEPVPQLEELSDEERLAALKLKAVDYVETTPSRPQPYMRLRDLQAEEIEAAPQKKSAVTAAWLAVLAVALLSFYALNRGAQQRGLQEDDLQLQEGSRGTAPSVVAIADRPSAPITYAVPTATSSSPYAGPGGDDLSVGERLMDEGRYDDAARAMEAYIARHPGSVRAQMSLARCYLKGGKKRKARMLCLKIFKTMRLSEEEDASLTQLWQTCMH